MADVWLSALTTAKRKKLLAQPVPSRWIRLQQVGLLFQWFFEEANIIDPDSTFAIDNDVQGGLFCFLTWLQKEWCLQCLPIHGTGNNRVHTSREVLTATNMAPHFQKCSAFQLFTFYLGSINELGVFDVKPLNFSQTNGRWPQS